MIDVPTFDRPHRRYNPLTGEWVLVSARRTSRPWLGQVERIPQDDRPKFDPACYLCPGTERAGGARNDTYDSTYVFTNDFPALLPDVAVDDHSAWPLFRAQTESGTCRVLCFSPRHDLTLAEMDLAAIEAVVDLWADQTAELGSSYPWVQVFENKGEAMGASNPHPHGQIWAGSSIPSLVQSEHAKQAEHLATNGRVLLQEYAEAEADIESRVVVSNDSWLIVVPYWAVWPFETLILPHRHIRRLPAVESFERAALAAALRELLVRYDNLFESSFPYSMGWHGAPFHEGPDEHWQLHAHVYPPMLRSAMVRKFMVGYELLAEPQRDLTAEDAAARLLKVPAQHYRAHRRTTSR
jgi:UDPglucose--hexose-1-phosphate uridylyltransferase